MVDANVLTGLLDTNAVIQSGLDVAQNTIYSNIPIVDWFLGILFSSIGQVSPVGWAFIIALISGLILTSKVDFFIKIFRIGAVIIIALIFFGIVQM